MIEFMHTLLPEPVLPAISMCGIFAISPTQALPSIPLPSEKESFDLASINSSDSIISLRDTVSVFLFGTSIPTADLPGIGASILIDLAAKLSAKSSDNLKILLTLTPTLGCNSYLVTVGPLVTLVTLASTPKLSKVF